MRASLGFVAAPPEAARDALQTCRGAVTRPNLALSILSGPDPTGAALVS